MNEERTLEYLRYYCEKEGKSLTRLAEECGYQPNTFYNWFSQRTRMTLDGLQTILDTFDQQAVVRDKDGKFHFDILPWMGKACRENEKWVLALFEKPRYAKNNIRMWVRHERGIKLYILIDILSVLGAELMIVKKARK